jgi:hypothetical protein
MARLTDFHHQHRLVDKIAQHLVTTPVRPVYLTGQADATWETARAQN